MPSSISLHIIAKDELNEVRELLANAKKGGVTKAYVTFSNKKAFEACTFGKGDWVEVDYRPWNDRFDEARNHNWSKSDCTYQLWIDSDDEFDFRAIPQLVQLMDEDNLDAIWLPYEYAYDEEGQVIALHWRERIVRRSKGWVWKGWVHENLITQPPAKSDRVDIPVKHRKKGGDEASQERNLRILQKAYQETNDPRYIHYYGITLFSMGRWQEAIDILKEYIAVGGWDEEIYRSLLRMSDASLNLGDKESALQYASRASILLPDYPDAYFSLAQIEFDDDNWKSTREWLKVAFSKKRPESASITDPTVPDKARLIGAMCEFQLKNYRDAVDLLKTVHTMDVSDLLPEFERQASIDRTAAVLPALVKHYEKPELLWNNLSEDLKYDGRFRKLREQVTEPKTWPEKSVVIFCGQGYEEWGPHTLDKGMGGSEEAIVYLSRELAKQGYKVFVYSEVSKAMEVDGVYWFPWRHIDKRDTFDTLVIWRYPQYVPQFKARQKFVDMHDLIPEKLVVPYPDATYLFKSAWHAQQYPQITNFNVISNGLKMEQFNG